MNTHLGAPRRDFDAGEFILVIALAFGLSIVGSLSAAFSYTGQPIEFGDAALTLTVGYELVIGCVVWVVLRARSWAWSDFAVHASTGSTIVGAVLGGVLLAAWYAIARTIGDVPVVLSASLLSVTLASVVNPLFEELLVLGYVVQALRKRFGLTTAMNVSLAIRLIYHLYEGPRAVIPIAIFGLTVTLVYIKMGRLWPSIVAHAIMDFVALIGE